MGYELQVTLELVCDIYKWENLPPDRMYCSNSLIENGSIYNPPIRCESTNDAWRELKKLGWYIQLKTYFGSPWGKGYCLCPEHNTPKNRKRCEGA